VGGAKDGSDGRRPADRHLVSPDDLAWRCALSRFSFETTDDLVQCPIRIIGQDRAQQALLLGLSMRSEGYNLFVTGDVGSGRSTIVRRMLGTLDRGETPPPDLVYVHNFQDPDQPRRLLLPAGQGRRLREAMDDLLEALARQLPGLFDSDAYRKQRTAIVDAAARDQKSRLKEFEKKVQEQGFAVVQIQVGLVTRPSLVPVVAGNPVDMDQLDALVEQGRFKREEYEQLVGRRAELAGEMESIGKALRASDRELRRKLAELDREIARPLVDESLSEIASSFEADSLEEYLEQVGEAVLAHLPTLREPQEPSEGEAGAAAEAPADGTRYGVNVVVDNAKTQGRPIIWETAPSYRNLFGTIERARRPGGEWDTDHMHIKAGSLLRASGGILVLDAMDVLVEPGVWSGLKRSLRNRTVDIQSFDPLQIFSSVSLKPETAPVDVKVVMIGTRAIYGLLYAVDEDFRKIFKIKSEFAMDTARSDDEIDNYACFVHKKVQDDHLPPFHRDAVAAVVEHGVRLAEDRDRLTTRFTDIADLVREAGYWSRAEGAPLVREQHVDQALERQVYRVSLLEERLRERIADGTLILELDGERVGQVNGLALFDLGDHVFAQPSRITATTAVGRSGIVDIDREADLSGAIHTKGVLILAGFLRDRFAQDKPLALTASLCFEQSYGGIDGDSASSAELYALLSSLADVPLRQGIAVTGSVNQRGEVQPIGGVNRKIEGFFDTCRLTGLTGAQGVMIPRRNLRQLMLRKDVVDHVRQGRFHVWAVSSIDEGLSVLSGAHPGIRARAGSYPKDSLYGRADTRLRTLAEHVRRFATPGDVEPLA
jgi:lon-related putative ATP-dependent protease